MSKFYRPLPDEPDDREPFEDFDQSGPNVVGVMILIIAVVVVAVSILLWAGVR